MKRNETTTRNNLDKITTEDDNAVYYAEMYLARIIPMILRGIKGVVRTSIDSIVYATHMSRLVGIVFEISKEFGLTNGNECQ